MKLEKEFGQKVLDRSILANTGRLGEYQFEPINTDPVNVLALPNSDWAKIVDAIETPFAGSYDKEEY